MSKLMNIGKKSYIFILLALFYIPLMIAVIFSFNKSPRKGEMSSQFTPEGNGGWDSLLNNTDIARGAFASTFIAIIVAIFVVAISLLTVFGLWRSRSKVAKGYVNGTSNIPLINPDVITAVSLTLLFTAMFGTLKFGDEGIERAIIGHITMILPFGITIMYPRSEKFQASQFEASKDLGYGPVRTWFKTYFRYMLGTLFAVFVVSIALSFDDFIITKTTSRINTLGTELYSVEKIKPWIFALGTTVLAVTLTTSIGIGLFTYVKEKRGNK